MDLVYIVIVVGISVVVSMPVGYLLGYRESRKPIEFRIGKVDLKDGDDIVLHCDRPISHEVAQRLRATMEERLPGHKCIVLDSALTMEVLSR